MFTAPVGWLDNLGKVVLRSSSLRSHSLVASTCSGPRMCWHSSSVCGCVAEFVSKGSLVILSKWWSLGHSLVLARHCVVALVRHRPASRWDLGMELFLRLLCQHHAFARCLESPSGSISLRTVPYWMTALVKLQLARVLEVCPRCSIAFILHAHSCRFNRIDVNFWKIVNGTCWILEIFGCSELILPILLWALPVLWILSNLLFLSRCPSMSHEIRNILWFLG